MEHGVALLIVARSDLVTGLEVFHRELTLPDGVTAPTIVSADMSSVWVGTSSGRAFTLDLTTLSIDEA